MKVAVIYNRESKSVINLFGTPNREKYGKKAIKRITDAIRAGGHQVIAVEGDKDLIDNLENFMPKVVSGERPGLAFNLSYGIQGQARYTHVPGILEMVGVPYVGSGPLAHSLCLDKVVTKMIFRQNNLPTPDFAVLEDREFEAPGLEYPLIIKPKNEAVSFGLAIVNDEKELRAAAGKIFDRYNQPALVERYIDGKEINVGVIGNSPPEAFPPVELVFGEGGPPIYTHKDKIQRSGREIGLVCPARIDARTAERAQSLAIRAFKTVGAHDCARVDMRLDSEGNIYLLEINSLPSLGEHGSYVDGAAHVGMDFPALVSRLIEEASSRYFGTPSPPPVSAEKKPPERLVFDYLTGRRDQMERRLAEWVRISSRTGDPMGHGQAVAEISSFMEDMALKPVKPFTDGKSVWTWETGAGMEGGVLLVAHVDVPVGQGVMAQAFRRDPEWLYGEGIGASRAPITMMEFAMRSLRAHRLLRRLKLGVLVYSDEGRDCRYSAPVIAEAMAAAGKVLVLRPGAVGDKAVTQRRGQRKYRLSVEGKPRRLGQALRQPDPLQWLFGKAQAIYSLSSRKERMALGAADIEAESYPMLLPHRAKMTLLTTFPTRKAGVDLDGRIREILGKKELEWRLDLVSDRPPMDASRKSAALLKELASVADHWEIPFHNESSSAPSVAGLAPRSTAVICGMGPVAHDVYTSHEAAQRISLIQRTLLLAEFLTTQIEERKPRGKSKKASARH